MNICFISNDNYTKYCYTAIFSMIRNAHSDDRLFVHILSDEISNENVELLLSLKTDKCNIEIIVPTFESMDTKIIVHRYKWLIPTILSHLDRILYLDCDIIVCDSIKKLYYDTDISEYPIAMAKDINSELFSDRMNIKQGFYCNSGVILINIPLWNNQNISNKLFEYTTHNIDKIEFKDQDSINAVLDGKIKLVDNIRYNLQCVASYIGNFDKLEFENAMNDPCIVHYITEKPLSIFNGNTPLLGEFWKYFTLTPWFKEDIYKYIRIIVNQELELFKNNSNFENKLNRLIDIIARCIPVRKWRNKFRIKFR